MKILVTGGTGMVGSKLCKKLAEAGHELVVLTRSPEKAKSRAGFKAEFVKWDALTAEWIPSRLTDGLDSVVNLAGEPLVEGRWTDAKKQRITQSRGEATAKLIEHLKNDGVKLKSFVSASAIGFYGDRGDEELNETSAKGSGFLANVCEDWERPVVESVGDISERHAIIRISVVLGEHGGFLGEVLPIFMKGLGGPLASGKQWMSWIHEQDLCAILEAAILKDEFSGVINASAPQQCRNSEMTKALGAAVGMPAVFPVPSFGLKMMFGDKTEMLLGSQKVQPSRLQQLGFTFSYPEVSAALASLIE